MMNLPDDIEGVSYRTGTIAWMDQIVFNQWLSEPRAISRDAQNRRRILFMDNCSGKKITEDMEKSLDAINTAINFIPSNSSNLCLPLDSFIIKEIKAVWRRE